MLQHIRLSRFSVFIAIALMSLLVACGTEPPTTGNASTNTTLTITSSRSPSSVPLKVTGVDINLSIPTVSKYTCGTNITETYTATFHFPADNAGGQVKFESTTNNGRSSQPATLAVNPGQTSAIYAFNWSGQTSADNTVPGRGGVMVTAPNSFTSDLVAPAGACTPPAATTPFKVTSIGLAAGPEVTAHRCGSSFTENYTVTFNVAPGGPGGTIVFQYTTNNGRASSPDVSLHVAAGQTTASYVFKWSGALPQDHTAPGVGIVMMSAPNQITSPSAAPEGGCTNM